MKKRIVFIDLARAFAIIFIVLGHIFIHSNHCIFLFKIIYSFNVALFFVISGYLYTNKQRFPLFLKNKFNRIMIPYFFWGVLFLIPYFILGETVGIKLGTVGNFNIFVNLFNILYGTGYSNALKQNTPLWFLPAIFSMNIMFYPFFNKDSTKKEDFFKIVSLIFISYISAKYFKFILPLGLNTVFNMGFFFYIGILIKKYNLIERSNHPLLIIFYFIIGFIAAINNSTVECVNYSYGNIIYMIISGTCFSLGIILIAYRIKSSILLEKIGRSTLSILIFHKIIIIIFQTKLGIISNYLCNSNFFIELIIAFCVSAITIGICCIINKIISRVFPILIGEK